MTTNLPAAGIAAALDTFATGFNARQIPYSLPSRIVGAEIEPFQSAPLNSNTYAREAWQSLTGTIPTLPSTVRAPGWFSPLQ